MPGRAVGCCVHIILCSLGIGIQVVTEANPHLAACHSREELLSKHSYRDLSLIALDFCVC